MEEILWPAATVLLGVALLYLSWIDLRSHRLPDRVTLPLIVTGLALSAFGSQSQLIASTMGGVTGFALFATIGYIYFKKYDREGLGLGDAKLFAAAGTWLGWAALPGTLLIAAGSALVFALLARRGRENIPFGPWISLAFFAMWVADRLASGR